MTGLTQHKVFCQAVQVLESWVLPPPAAAEGLLKPACSSAGQAVGKALVTWAEDGGGWRCSAD